ncbi:acetoacetate decarboxylase [Tsukamurella sp. PLM1]|uniref:acetoacetate decarboxylase n=1 Tax=Tsukamurella sp. PLM1 TaxID=2929795 RepID=UPI00206102CA|nr:acetoacetate decarboxylase [Tsukamurella sp. PLM1]BDH58296.1 acetoacetate decarboxylase [Tsukamurella sp. PLM1]
MTSTTTATVDIDLGGRTVAVPKGGLFDRYRMDTPLDEVANDPRVPGVDFFRTLPKTEVQSPIGPTRTPNFYYAMSSARLTMLAPSRAIRRRIPRELAPLEIAPGLGLVSVMLFRYDVCDIDFYTEAAVGVAVRPARNGGIGTAVADVDIAFSAPTPKQTAFTSGEKVSTLTSYTQRDGAWHSTLNQTNVLSGGGTRFPRDIDLTIGDGRMADELRALKPLRAIAFDVNTSAQAALHMPVPVSVRRDA